MYLVCNAPAMITCSRLRPGTSVTKKTTSHRNALRFRASAEGEAASEPAPSADSSSSTVFYAGSTYSEDEWAKAVAEGAVSVAPASPVESQVSDLSLADIMSFSGPGPELINGRLAMLAFVSALFAELASGEGVWAQWAEEPTGVLLTFLLFSTASLIPMLNSPEGAKREAFGPFTPKAEELNGRAAMIGFLALLVVEGVHGGQALF
jgi:hypothetical protein